MPKRVKKSAGRKARVKEKAFVLAWKTRSEAFIDPLRRCGRTIWSAENRMSVPSRIKRRSRRAPTHPSSERGDGTTSVHKTVGLLNTLHLEKSSTWAHVSRHTRQTLRVTSTHVLHRTKRTVPLDPTLLVEPGSHLVVEVHRLVPRTLGATVKVLTGVLGDPDGLLDGVVVVGDVLLEVVGLPGCPRKSSSSLSAFPIRIESCT